MSRCDVAGMAMSTPWLPSLGGSLAWAWCRGVPWSRLGQVMVKDWSGLIQFENEVILFLIKSLYFAGSYFLIQNEFGMVPLTKVVHLVVYLDDMQRLAFVWFRNFEIERLKVVTRI